MGDGGVSGVGRPARAVRAVTAGNAGPLTLEGTRSYLVGRERAVLVDPGPEGPDGGSRWDELAAGATVEVVALTHAHPDHAAGARAAAERFGADVAGSSAALVKAGLQGRSLSDGDAVHPEGPELTALETPGHSSDHLTFWRETDGLLFTGDLVLGEGSSLVAYPDGSVGEYLRSLERLMDLDPSRILPGHGPDVDDAPGRLREYRDHRMERDRQVHRAVREGARSVQEIRERVYGDLPAELRRAAEATICAHLVHLRERALELPEITGWVRMVEG